MIQAKFVLGQENKTITTARINNLHLVKRLVAFGSQTTWSGGANGETLEFY